MTSVDSHICYHLVATTDLFFPFQDHEFIMLHLPYPFPATTRKMEYKPLPENSTTEKSEPSNTMVNFPLTWPTSTTRWSLHTQQPFDIVDIEKSAAISSSGYGTIPSYASKEGVLRAPQKQDGRGIWISFVQSLVAVGMFTAMAVTLVLVIL